MANGNGRAVFPPGTLTPVRRYAQPPPPRRSGLQVLGRFLAWAFASVLLVVGGVAGGAYLYLDAKVADIRALTPAEKRAGKHLDVALPGRAAIALVIGYDARRGREAGGPSRSDTVMLLRADPQTETVSMLSFPRDLWVEIHCPGRLPFHSRINQAYAICGPEGTLQTVKDLIGLPINYLITVDFHGFKAVVNKMHGVWIDVDRRYYNPHGTGFAAIDLHPGYQKLNGQQALDFVRFRHTDSDFYRLARQQAFVKAFKQRVSASVSVFKLPGLVNAVTSNVHVGVGGGRQLGKGTVISWARFAYQLPPGHFFQPKIQNIRDDGSSDLLVDDADLDAATSDFVNPDVEAGKKATNVALGLKPKTKAPKPAETTVTVLNGNGVDGSAATAAVSLADRGYVVLEPPGRRPANAPKQDYFHTIVLFNPHLRGAKASATAVKNVFSPADLRALPARLRPLSRAMVTVIVGTAYHGEIGPAPRDETPTRQPAFVRFDPYDQQLALKELKPVGFRLQVPTVIERNSRLDYEEPARRYRVAKGRWAARLVFRTGGREYWGIEETDWTAAPVLADRSFRHVLKSGSRRRIFDFYYSGSHLHMVVLREHGATYWVVNTLLDSLSNETMIAIAKGLKPLPRR